MLLRPLPVDVDSLSEVTDAIEAGEQQPGADDQDERHRDLRDDEPFTNAHLTGAACRRPARCS